MKLSLTSVLVIFSQFINPLVYASEDEVTRAIGLNPDLLHGKEVYELCAVCHEANGWGENDGSVPVIAGQHPKVIIKQLADIRARNRENPTMYPFTDPEAIGGAQSIADVAAYIATLPGNPEPSAGDGKDLESGKALYEQHCITCHGENGQGNDDAYFPRIQGQHYGYLNRQLHWFQEGLRKNANPAMLEKIKGMSESELSRVADYVSRMTVKK